MGLIKISKEKMEGEDSVLSRANSFKDGIRSRLSGKKEK